MDKDTIPQTARPRLNLYTKALRRERIFSQLQLGASYADVAREEGISEQRIRKIVADALKRQEVDDLPDHALLQLFRLEGAQALAAKTIAAGDLKAITPYLQILDRLDRYRKAGTRKEFLRRRRAGKTVRQDEPHRRAARGGNPQIAKGRRRASPRAGPGDAAGF